MTLEIFSFWYYIQLTQFCLEAAFNFIISVLSRNLIKYEALENPLYCSSFYDIDVSTSSSLTAVPVVFTAIAGSPN